jgi:hypothetical protein
MGVDRKIDLLSLCYEHCTRSVLILAARTCLDLAAPTFLKSLAKIHQHPHLEIQMESGDLTQEK